MTVRLTILALLFPIPLSMLPAEFVYSDDLHFTSYQTSPASRIDALAYLGSGVVVAGTRDPDPGVVYKSTDYGVSWRKIGNVTGPDFITCLASGGAGLGFLLTGNQTHVWRTTDYGDTWSDLGQVSKAANPVFANAYGLLVTSQGTVIVADADREGGHIHRSANRGLSWEDQGPISTLPLYRLVEVGDGIIANGWAGHVYKSTDDGLTWRDLGRIAQSELYAIEYIDGGTVLLGTEKGRIFTSSDNGESWIDQGIVAPFADDFVWAGGRKALYSTYAGERSLYLSDDLGKTWISLGSIRGGGKDDWIDHAIHVGDPGHKAIVGGTNKGTLLYSRISE